MPQPTSSRCSVPTRTVRVTSLAGRVAGFDTLRPPLSSSITCPDDANRARGSGAKRAKTEVSYTVTAAEPFNRYQVGEIVVKVDKDREGHLPFQRSIKAGTALTGGFIFEPEPEFQVAVIPANAQVSRD